MDENKFELDNQQFLDLCKIVIPHRWEIVPEDKQLWTNARQIPAIERLITDFQQYKKRFFLIHAGRRSFKSEIAKRLAVWYCINHPESHIIYAGPTVDHTRRIAWEDLKKLSTGYGVKKILEMDLEIRYRNGSVLRIAGMDVPERVVGTRLQGIVIDEMGDIPRDDFFDIHVLPALADTGGWSIMSGVPRGRRGQFWIKYNDIVRRPEDFSSYGLYSWTTAAVRGDDFVEEYKHTMSKYLFEQEMLGKFTSAEGLAYIFDRQRHLNDELMANTNLPIDFCCDFNVQGMFWPVCQSNKETTIVLDEVSGRNCSIESMCNLVKGKMVNLFGQRCKSHHIRFYGDATGGYIRDPSAHMASWSIIKDQFAREGWNVEFKLTRQNPRVGDRREIVNARLQTADGNIHCQISPKAKYLIDDFENMTYADFDESNKERAGKDISHSSDAFGYYCYFNYKTNYRQGGITNFPV